MNYVAAIHGNWKEGTFSHMMIYNETVNGRRHGGRQIPFDLNELKANNHAFIVQAVNEHDENEHSIGEIFLSYDQALKFTWLCSMIKYNERIKEDFSYQNNPKRFVEKYKSEVEKILLSMKKINFASFCD